MQIYDLQVKQAFYRASSCMHAQIFDLSSVHVSATFTPKVY